MKAYLLDLNVLIALAWPNHIHHESAHAWFREHQQEGWATCPLTQAGFIRVSSNPAMKVSQVTPLEALIVLGQITRVAKHEFWPAALPLSSEHYPAEKVRGHRQVTDAYLLALCRHFGGKLATFDSGLLSLLSPKEDPEGCLTIIVPS